jgi:hypothetical protein
MDVQSQLETPTTDHRPEVLAALRQQLIDKGVERGLAGEAAYILAYVDPLRDRTAAEQQTIKLAFQNLQWEGLGDD